MRNRIGVVVLMFILLAVSVKAPAAPAAAEAPGNAAALATSTRLVVWEALMHPSWPVCEAAGPEVQNLINYYKLLGKPVAIIEEHQPAVSEETGFLHDRKKAYSAALSGSTNLPVMLFDAGYQTLTGWHDFYNDNKNVVDAELLRAPEANVSATVWRVGNHLEYEVKVTNLSGLTLDYAANVADVTVLVYEDIDADEDPLTTQYARTSVSTNITTPLANGATGTYRLVTPDLSGVVWINLHSVAFVEFRPFYPNGAYHMLQAAYAVAPTFTTQQTDLVYVVDAFNPKDITGQVNFLGSPSTMVWTGSANQPWITLDPTTNQIATPSTVHINSDTFERGVYTGTITYTGTIGSYTFTKQVPVEIRMTDVIDTFFPTIFR